MNGQIAVLLPHYNNYSGLQLTLNSLLNESEEFTVFIFDDGSDEVFKTEKIIKDFSNQLDIRFIKNAVNIGITETLNKGLKHIFKLNKYDLIARIDAGDVSLNDRFNKQKQAFVNDKNLGLVASWVRFVDMDRNKLFDFKPPANHIKLKKDIFLYNPFVHSAVMYRLDSIIKVGFYSSNYPALEDHACFFKIIKVFKTCNIPNFLMECEISKKGVSVRRRKEQTKSRIKLLLKEYQFGFIPIVGIIRACASFLLPQALLLFIKKKIFYT